MVINAGEYVLRSFSEQDMEDYYNLAHDKLVKKYVPYAYPRDIKEAKENVFDYSNGDMKNDFYLLIEKENKLIGMIIAVKINDKMLDISAFLANEYRGKGIMTIVMNSFIKYLKEKTNYEKLMMVIDKENTASNNQIKKIGGIFSKVYQNNNVYEVLLK